MRCAALTRCAAGALLDAHIRLHRPLIAAIICAFPDPPDAGADAVSHKAILITGAAGYIGSHVLLQLQSRGEHVVAIDNLHTGFRQALLSAPLIVGDIGDRELLAGVSREHAIDTVMHFAASTIVPESVHDPLKYYGNNTCATRNLLDSCMRAGIRQLVSAMRSWRWHRSIPMAARSWCRSGCCAIRLPPAIFATSACATSTSRGPICRAASDSRRALPRC
jgi:hypothetical protein